MTFKIPNRLISTNDLNNWSIYKDALEKYEYVKKYLGEMLEYWVISLPNPLEIPEVFYLFEDRLSFLEDRFKIMESSLGEENLKTLFKEREKKSVFAFQNFRSLISLNGEVIVYSELKKGDEIVNKIKEIGDFETKNKIISVKTITSVDYNYVNIENLLRAMICIDENQIIREKFNQVSISNAESLKYNLIEDLLDFIRKDMLKFLQYLFLVRLTLPEIGEQNSYSYKKIIIHTDVHEKSKRKEISFAIEGDEKGMKDNNSVKITFKENVSFKGIFSVTYDTNAYWIGEELDIEKIAKRIQFHVDSIKIKEHLFKEFEMWIVLPLHDKYSHYVFNNLLDFQMGLKEKINHKNHRIFLLIVPEMNFSLSKNIKIQLS